MNPVMPFVQAMNNRDLGAVAVAFHPDFEMVVPQHPARGFKGRKQEVRNMEHLLQTYPDGRINLLRMIETPRETWAETTFSAPELEIAPDVIFDVDPEADTIRGGRFYSEPVDRGGPEINEWMRGLRSPG
jgi:SnoaL-like domain